MFDRVEKYDILEEIGRGGMATVYRARDTRLHREVALKVMHPHLQGAKEARVRFEREAQTVARLRHGGLLEIYDYSGEDSPVSFIATELLTGPTLKSYSDEHPNIPAELAACMVLQVAEALSAAHEAGVIHRDVKPENVMFHHGHVKLTDFGIAQLVDVQGMTTTGQVLGSPGHMAPEQIEGKECTVQSDLFSLGTVLYLLAVGELPFSGPNTPHVLKRIVEGKYQDPLQIRSSIGAPLQRIIWRCLATDVSKRYQSAGELAEDLGRFIAGSGIEDPAEALSSYLADPETYAREFTAALIERLIERGEAAQRARNRPAALDDFNRVLALDDGNPRVLASVQRLSRRSRVRRVGLSAVAICAAGGVVAALVGLREESRPSVAKAPPLEVVAPLPKPAKRLVPEPSGQQHAATTSSRDQAPLVQPQASERVAPGGAQRASARGETRGRDGPRSVRFRPFPANVSISVDGGPAKPFGPSFRQVELSPGRHTFKFMGAHDCCEDLEFEQVIPAGPGTTTVARSLEFKPAGLYVVTERPANVSVNGGAVRGRTRSVLQVPHERALLQTHVVIVSADGFEPFRASVQLRAGQVKTLEVPVTALKRAKGARRMEKSE
ncbi:MAG: serine/threonine-protein kinase [Myxococcales bacterium]|nr:serine/threonine-protein kinase [Myxococcales bacterium]